MQEVLSPKKNLFEDQRLVLHPEHMDDVMLWRSFRSGNQKALIIIFDRFSKPMYNYGYKIVGESELVKDGIQELFIEIWKNRAGLRDTDSIRFYLFKALRWKLMRMKDRRENRLFGRLTSEHCNETSPSHEFVIISEQVSFEKRERVLKLLDGLTPRQHEAIYLRYFEELNCDQIAAVMKLRKQVVYNLIHRALVELRKITRQDFLS